MLVGCKKAKTPKPDTQNLAGTPQSDWQSAYWHNAAEKLLLPMLSIFGIDTAGNENSETIITFDLIDTATGLQIVYYDRHGKIIDETTAPFLKGDTASGWAYAQGFKLYDFNKDGIPEIVVKFVYPESSGGFNLLYIYADGDYNIALEPQMPLTPIEPLYELQQNIEESIKQKLFF